ncbi:uncharacterized protein N7443_010506 [Penicillium atrosanguineum]|uniref:uncharacterized protein n=1 Tax=Penicillium atrosanguineum TaxID=1132637 RepID=UPI002385B30B|nr:uncharacterized protein N7443_010506 [Penicillium atrosanguineum]KAJ5290253.1 hypothetical protein N7443_010506 [Penicillium atrosanguineum]
MSPTTSKMRQITARLPEVRPFAAAMSRVQQRETLTMDEQRGKPGLLIDPSLQDLSPSTRDYIAYFEQECSQDCVIHNVEPANPFKEFMRLIPSCPGFRDAVVSVAALHRAQRVSSSILTTEDVNGMMLPNSSPESQAAKQLQQSPDYYNALRHKQRTLAFLRKESEEGFMNQLDGTIATIILSTWFETMDSGRESWKYHLLGLRELVQRCGFSAIQSGRGSLAASIPQVYEYFDTTYAIFEIIGSTFVEAKQPYRPLFTTIPMLEVLKRSETQTWVGCPADLLFVLLLVNSASSRPAEDKQELLCNTLSLIRGFSPMNWALTTTHSCHVKSRYHLASLYQAAVEIYARQIFSMSTGQYCLTQEGPANSIDSLMLNFQAIDRQDTHFKSLIWPAFVIGAEMQTENQRAMIAEVFAHLWKLWCCPNVASAFEVLEKIWARRSAEGTPRPWIEYVYEWGEDWIFL